MPIRSVKQRSDRGSIRDINKAQGEFNEPPSDEELRLKKLYEYAELTNNEQLKKSLGFIVMPGDKSSLPISVYRHREYVNSLSQDRIAHIERFKQELLVCFGEDHQPINIRKSRLKQELSKNAILFDSSILPIIKTASTDAICIQRSFRRIKR